MSEALIFVESEVAGECAHYPTHSINVRTNDDWLIKSDCMEESQFDLHSIFVAYIDRADKSDWETYRITQHHKRQQKH